MPLKWKQAAFFISLGLILLIMAFSFLSAPDPGAHVGGRLLSIGAVGWLCLATAALSIGTGVVVAIRGPLRR